MEAQEKYRHLINQSIILDLEEIKIWKQCLERNTKFAIDNVKMADKWIKNQIKFLIILNSPLWKQPTPQKKS